MSQHSNYWNSAADEDEDDQDESPLVKMPVTLSNKQSDDGTFDPSVAIQAILKLTLGALLVACFFVGAYLYHSKRPVADIVVISSTQHHSKQSSSSSSVVKPDWVTRYHVDHLFDWTYQRNGQKALVDAHLSSQKTITPPPAGPISSPRVVNDALKYFSTHKDEGVVVDDIALLPNPSPHPLPIAKDWSSTCKKLNLMSEWATCKMPQDELNDWLPATKRFVVSAVFDAFVDRGSCHGEVPGTTYTASATYHFQRWTNNPCHNNAIATLPRPDHMHDQLINTVGTYLAATGHFAPQQLPRILRLLATCPQNAKLLVAQGGIADKLVDVMVERGIVTRDRIVHYDGSQHYARVVYRSDPWPYLTDKYNHYAHDRTDMQLVHRAMVDELDDEHRDLVIVIDRGQGQARSIKQHAELLKLVENELADANLKQPLTVYSFDASGHMRDHIKLFSRARVIIGPHGAGFINLYWANPGTYSVEVGYTESMTFPEMYAEMAMHLDHKYYVCKGKGAYEGPIDIDMEDMTWIMKNIIADMKKQN